MVNLTQTIYPPKSKQIFIFALSLHHFTTINLQPRVCTLSIILHFHSKNQEIFQEQSLDQSWSCLWSLENEKK